MMDHSQVLRKLIDNFVSEITLLAKREALEAVEVALGVVVHESRRPRRGPLKVRA